MTTTEHDTTSAEPAPAPTPDPTPTPKARRPRKTGNPAADRKPVPKPAPGTPPEPVSNETSPPHAGYATRPPTQTVIDYMTWLSEVTGLTFTEREIQIAFIVQSPLRQKWQRLNRDGGAS
jgi:hypothetical protein